MNATVLFAAGAIVFLAAVATGYTGFAFNLMTVPLLSFVIPVKDAVVVAILVGLFVSASVVWRNWADTRWRLLRPLAMGLVPGVVLGVLIFRWIAEDVLRVCVGALTVVLAIYLRRRQSAAVRHQSPHLLTGVGVGALGGALSSLTGMGGPPVIAYLSHVTDRPAYLRATMAASAGCLQLTGLVAHGISGDFTTDELGLGLVLVPAALLGVLAGSVLFRRAVAWYPVTVSIMLALVGTIGIAMPVVGALR